MWKLINDANRLRAAIKTDGNNTAEVFDENYYETASRAQISFENILQKIWYIRRRLSSTKTRKAIKNYVSQPYNRSIFPFTFEANVNVDIPPYQIPSTMLHELSHLRGFMREDEANFISY